MIRVTSPTSSGCTTHHLAHGAIARITEASSSGQWHGIRSIIKLFDGTTLECSETAQDVLRAMEEDQA